MKTNNIKYSRETGALKVLASIIACPKVSDDDKKKSWSIIEKLCGKYYSEKISVNYGELEETVLGTALRTEIKEISDREMSKVMHVYDSKINPKKLRSMFTKADLPIPPIPR